MVCSPLPSSSGDLWPCTSRDTPGVCGRDGERAFLPLSPRRQRRPRPGLPLGQPLAASCSPGLHLTSSSLSPSCQPGGECWEAPSFPFLVGSGMWAPSACMAGGLQPSCAFSRCLGSEVRTTETEGVCLGANSAIQHPHRLHWSAPFQCGAARSCLGVCVHSGGSGPPPRSPLTVPRLEL